MEQRLNHLQRCDSSKLPASLSSLIRLLTLHWHRSLHRFDIPSLNFLFKYVCVKKAWSMHLLANKNSKNEICVSTWRLLPSGKLKSKSKSNIELYLSLFVTVRFTIELSDPSRKVKLNFFFLFSCTHVPYKVWYDVQQSYNFLFFC